MGLIERGGNIAKASLEGNRFNERQRVLGSAVKFQLVVFNEVTYSGPGSCGFVTDRKNPSGKEVTPVVFNVGNLFGTSKNESGHTIGEINAKAKELGFEFVPPEFEGVFQLQDKCPSFNKIVKDNGNIYVGMDPVRLSESYNAIEFFNGEYPDYNGKQFVPVQGAAFESGAKSKHRSEDRFRNEEMFLFALGEKPSLKSKKK